MGDTDWGIKAFSGKNRGERGGIRRAGFSSKAGFTVFSYKKAFQFLKICIRNGLTVIK